MSTEWYELALAHITSLQYEVRVLWIVVLAQLILIILVAIYTVAMARKRRQEEENSP